MTNEEFQKANPNLTGLFPVNHVLNLIDFYGPSNINQLMKLFKTHAYDPECPDDLIGQALDQAINFLECGKFITASIKKDVCVYTLNIEATSTTIHILTTDTWTWKQAQ